MAKPLRAFTNARPRWPTKLRSFHDGSWIRTPRGSPSPGIQTSRGTRSLKAKPEGRGLSKVTTWRLAPAMSWAGASSSPVGAATSTGGKA